MRWGIETSFRDIKYAAGLLFFHSKKNELVLQEIYAKLIVYNFSELIVGSIVVEKKTENMLIISFFQYSHRHMCRVSAAYVCFGAYGCCYPYRKRIGFHTS